MEDLTSLIERRRTRRQYADLLSLEHSLAREVSLALRTAADNVMNPSLADWLRVSAAAEGGLATAAAGEVRLLHAVTPRPGPGLTRLVAWLREVAGSEAGYRVLGWLWLRDRLIGSGDGAAWPRPDRGEAPYGRALVNHLRRRRGELTLALAMLTEHAGGEVRQAASELERLWADCLAESDTRHEALAVA